MKKSIIAALALLALSTTVSADPMENLRAELRSKSVMIQIVHVFSNDCKLKVQVWGSVRDSDGIMYSDCLGLYSMLGDGSSIAVDSSNVPKETTYKEIADGDATIMNALTRISDITRNLEYITPYTVANQ